ncbi:MAG: DUF2061 domain-containing protein [archaeon]
MDSHRRTLMKSITWRVIALFVAYFVAYAFTSKPLESGSIAITVNLINMVGYYFHERVWNKINYGRK